MTYLAKEKTMDTIAANPRRLSWWTINRGFLVIAAIVGVLSLSALRPASAEAGNYTSKQCNLQAGVSSYDAVFTTPHVGFSGPVLCPPPAEANSKGLTIQNPVPISGFGGTARWIFTAPPGTVITSVSFHFRTILDGAFTGGIFFGYDGGGGGSWGPTNGAWVPANTVTTRIRWFQAAMQCGGTCNNQGATVQFRDFTFDMLDEGAPQIDSVGGTLLASGDRHGTETLAINASDPGSGVRSATVTVNGGQIAELVNPCQLLGNGQTYSFTPCPTSPKFATQLNTESPPWKDGANSVQVCVYDYATGGGPNSDCETRTVQVDNSCQGSGGLPATAIVNAGIENKKGKLRPKRKVKSTRGATVRGTLISGTGAGVPGANVCLYAEADAPGEDRQLSQIARTQNDGTFAVEVPSGPSRDLDLVYRYSNHVVKHETLRLESRVRPTLKIRPKKLGNGAAARFKGRIPGPNQANRGVTLQAKAGKKWRTFKQVRTNDKGKFKAKYRFNQTRGRVVYRFRARVKRQGGYPYAPGSSPKRKVKVVG